MKLYNMNGVEKKMIKKTIEKMKIRKNYTRISSLKQLESLGFYIDDEMEKMFVDMYLSMGKLFLDPLNHTLLTTDYEVFTNNLTDVKTFPNIIKLI